MPRRRATGPPHPCAHARETTPYTHSNPRGRAVAAENAALRERNAELESALSRTEGLCEVLDDGGGWTSSLRTRATWLLGLLVCQSCSSFVLADNEALLVAHPTVIYFMTMLVGAGGNAGNQAAVRIIRGLATGEVDPAPTERTAALVSDELRRALALAFILVVAVIARPMADPQGPRAARPGSAPLGRLAPALASLRDPCHSIPHIPFHSPPPPCSSPSAPVASELIALRGLEEVIAPR